MVTTLWSVDTTKDASTFEAQVRASAYCTMAYASELRQSPKAPPDGTWSLWASHRAYTTVSVAAGLPESGGPIATPTEAYAQDVATVTPVGRDGWSGSAQTWVEFVELTRPTASSGWRVAAVETAP